MKFVFLILGILSPILLLGKTIYIVPVGGHDAYQFFNNPYSYRDEVAKPFCELRKALISMGYEVKFTYNGANLDDAVAIISLNETNQTLLDNIASKISKERRLLFIFEPPVVMPTLYSRVLTQYFGKIFVMFDDLVDSKEYFKFHYPQPRNEVIKPIPDFSEKKLLTFIGSNWGYWHEKELYSERRDMVAFLKANHPEDFDLYGRDWYEYKATLVQSKWETIKNYKFCFCYENMKDQYGYVTEKIFDAMIGGAVPIYYGATNIEKYVPKSCFIDRRDFTSLEELYQFVKNMDRSTYENYLRAIDEYYTTPQARLFSIENFVESIVNEIKNIDIEN